MKLAIMQPYFFPYIGYFQLINAVEKFVIYDDVNFIKQGWINRNAILMHCRPQRFTVPLSGASSFKKIASVSLSTDPTWRRKFLKALVGAYGKAPYFSNIYQLVAKVLESEGQYIGALALNSLRAVTEYLGLATEIVPTSSVYRNSDLKGAARIMDICRLEKANEYLNMAGGMHLYDRDEFAAHGIHLAFLSPEFPAYRQFGCDFVPALSILDVLMFNDPDHVRRQLSAARVV